MSIKVGIHQPSYAAWCGYFSKIRHSDIFIFLDDAQMSKNNVMNRNQVKINGKAKWLTVPVHFSLGDAIRDVTFADEKWADKHISTLTANYSCSPFFSEVMELLNGIYSRPHANLADLNIDMTHSIMDYLGIDTPCVLSSSLDCPGKNDDRLVSLVGKVGGSTYLSGPGGLLYQDPKKFSDAGIDLVIKSYNQISYHQLGEEFIPNLSIFDALFNSGKDTLNLLEYV